MGHSALLGVRPEPPGCAIKAFFPFCSLSECACQHPPDKQNCVPHRGSLGHSSCHKRLQYGFCNVKDPLQSTLVRTPWAHACGVLPMAGGWTPPTPPRCCTKQLDPNSGAPHCSRRVRVTQKPSELYTMHHIHNAPCEMTFPDFNYAQESLVSIAAHS